MKTMNSRDSCVSKMKAVLVFHVYERAQLFKYNQNKLRGPSPRTKYTDRATAACRGSLVPTFADRGVSRSQCGGFPTAVFSAF
jgi:hypothetical protein